MHRASCVLSCRKSCVCERLPFASYARLFFCIIWDLCCTLKSSKLYASTGRTSFIYLFICCLFGPLIRGFVFCCSCWCFVSVRCALSFSLTDFREVRAEASDKQRRAARIRRGRGLQRRWRALRVDIPRRHCVVKYWLFVREGWVG